MFYYEVAVSSARYHGGELLTYASSSEVALGSIVSVPLRNDTVAGLVLGHAPLPKFATKPIVDLLVPAPLPKPLIELWTWFRDYYPAPLGIITNQFLPATLSKRPIEISNSPASSTASFMEQEPPLTPEQEKAISVIRKTSDGILLHGDTGTGKTRLYLELAHEVLLRGQSVLVLTPEIGLTPQLAASFARAFPGRVRITHSGLSPKKRQEVWLEALTSKQPLVVVGPRSCLFVPLSKIGLIVVDEAHDHAYKQDQTPRYQAVRVAARLAQLHGARLVLGSATPSVADYYYAEAKKMNIVRLTTPALSAAQGLIPPVVSVVDLRNRDLFTKHPHLSDSLLKQIELHLGRKEQSLIFLNRRGTARMVLCQQCGWQSLCPNCSLPLTYHGDKHEMRCHTCGYHKPMLHNCPQCGSIDLVLKSIGTKLIFEELQRSFPKARINRFDTDNTAAEGLVAQYERLSAGDIDIAVGTQLLIKGLDLPHLGLVGVVLADSALYLPDYTAEEQTYQMLTQVMGRVNRGHRAGHVIIQSYQPDNMAIQAVVKKDWAEFYKSQLAERKEFNYPPFCHLLKLGISRKARGDVIAVAESLHHQLSPNTGLEIVGPSPSFPEKQRGAFHWQLILKARRRSDLVEVVKHLPAKYTYDLDPSNLL